VQAPERGGLRVLLAAGIEAAPWVTSVLYVVYCQYRCIRNDSSLTAVHAIATSKTNKLHTELACCTMLRDRDFDNLQNIQIA
jgi:hypothetical protein